MLSRVDAVELSNYIYNGLYGSYGGQQVSDTDEESLGAITIANLNDTDGDTVIDNIDNFIASTPGRATDIDLSRLTIELTGAVAPTCEFVDITLSPNLKLWDSQNKGTLVSNRIPVADLPKDVYVEAIAVSSTMRDYNITVGLLDETGTVVKSDRVVVTALWVEHLASYRTYSSTPTPMALGIDKVSLVKYLNIRFIATDGTRYGYGVFGDPATFAEPAGFDHYLGGRILHEFKIKPNALIPNLATYNIKFDITRRIEGIHEWVRVSGTKKITTYPFNPVLEFSRDDLTNNDEDLIPSMSAVDKIFSYDAPAIGRIMSNAIERRDLRFEEFVRVSFSSNPTGNSQSGGMCSKKVDWQLKTNAAMTGSRNSSSPNNESDIHLEEITTSGLIYTRPRISPIYASNGPIVVAPVGVSNPDGGTVFLTSKNDSTGKLIWEAASRIVFSGGPASPPFTNIGTSNASATGPWTISSSIANITITNNPAIPYVPGVAISFIVFNGNSTDNFVTH